MWVASMATSNPHPAVAGQGLKHAQPDALPAPAIEAVVDGRVGAVLGWTVAPAPRALEHVHDARDHPTVIDPAGSLTPPRQQQLRCAPTPYRSATSEVPLHQEPPDPAGNL